MFCCVMNSARTNELRMMFLLNRKGSDPCPLSPQTSLADLKSSNTLKFSKITVLLKVIVTKILGSTFLITNVVI